MIALYHGTNQAFDTIDMQRGLPNKDFISVVPDPLKAKLVGAPVGAWR